MQRDDFDFKKIDEKWQAVWEANDLNRRSIDPTRPKYYILDMFPYPSAEGLHVGHPEGYTASDIVSRYQSMNGFNVLHPMGWDAFGLPTENYAIKMKIHPQIATERNITNFRRQIKRLGFSYDWSREVNTSDPEYYRWTQWIFLQLYNKGLAYISEAAINFCPECKTGLANEEVSSGHCERCGSTIERRSMKQWMLKITAYADRLLEDLDSLDWPEKIKAMQRHWIGKSEGAEIQFKLQASDECLTVFTTRPDTLFGATYLVLAPEHPLLKTRISDKFRPAYENYLKQISSKSDLERTELSKEKTGIDTGLKAIHPISGQHVPIFASDYVLMSYGTGSIMAVPAHDQRDYDFAKVFDLPIIPVILPEDAQAPDDRAYETEGIMINSDQFNGMPSEKAKQAIIECLEKDGTGRKTIQYRLRDWVFSRQRFWGEPIPIIHCDCCGIVPLSENDLPLELPKVDHYEPSGTGESPLAKMEDWVNTSCPVCKGPAKRETNTMPQWAGSCWYYLRYIDPKNKQDLASREAINYWLPVDLYIGGAEHAVLHLLYARFWHKFLYDLGKVNTPEPFLKLRNQGMVLAEDGRKMSKSLGNVINPDEVLDQYGADVVRCYEMFMGPFDQESLWSTQAIEGVNRFIRKVWALFEPSGIGGKEASQDTLRLMHKTIAKVSHDIQHFSFNTAISAMMILVNHLGKEERRSRQVLETLLQLLSPFAPHLCEELWQELGHQKSIFLSKWPQFDPELAKDEEIELPVQVNGKLREKLMVSANIEEAELKDLVLSSEKVQQFLNGQEIKKWIIIPGRLVNIVV
jgi:leucyl-tRNA synthetase